MGSYGLNQLEMHRSCAIKFHDETWDLIEKIARTPEEDELMVHTAHASCRHWLEAGTSIHHQRGEWLIARVYTVLGRAEEALLYANRCLELTNRHAEKMEDFDFAFAYESMARSSALAGRRKEALKFLELARKAGEVIRDPEDRRLFFDELRAGEWYGIAWNEVAANQG